MAPNVVNTVGPIASNEVTRTRGSLLERLQNGVVVAAEGYLFELERRGYLKAGAFVPEVVLDFPDALRELHREFVRAGSEVVVAFTYYGHRDKLRVIGRENDLEALNVQAVKIAREVADEFKQRDGIEVLVAGNICNTWCYDSDNAEESSKVVRAQYEEQVAWAKQAGADFIIAETISYLGEALIALEVIKRHGLPAVVTFGALCGEKTQEGNDYVEACQKLEAAGADVVGFNCFRGPNTLLPLLRRLRAAVKCPIAAQPVPYETTNEEPTFQNLKHPKTGKNSFPIGLERHLLTRFELADFAREAREIGVNYIGVCCGNAPHYIREISEALGRIVPASKYSADLSQHGILGADEVVKKHQKAFVNQWK